MKILNRVLHDGSDLERYPPEMVFIIHRLQIFRQKYKELLRNQETLKSVSYTHLDVYKRQIYKNENILLKSLKYYFSINRGFRSN